MFAQSLTELANKNATDKGTEGPSDQWSAHNYTDIYEVYFEKFRQQPINILEIGLGVHGENWPTLIAHGRNPEGGASLKTWYDYFPKAQIYGADINAASHLNNDRIKTFVLDQGNIQDLQAFANAINNIQFDIIIDDGSHRPDHQQISLSFFFKMLKSGGLYVVEDLMDNGLGDNVSEYPLQSCADVKKTRTVFKQFQKTGNFAEPNALTDSENLAKSIEYLRFHVPQKAAVVEESRWERVKARLVGKPLRTRWLADSEKLCVLRKK